MYKNFKKFWDLKKKRIDLDLLDKICDKPLVYFPALFYFKNSVWDSINVSTK